MKRFLGVVAILGIVAMGCADVATINESEAVDAGADCDAPKGCEPSAVIEAEFPGVSGPVHTFCSSCDEGFCDAHGDVCEKYGAPCMFNGIESVCRACCNGETAELRCAEVTP